MSCSGTCMSVYVVVADIRHRGAYDVIILVRLARSTVYQIVAVSDAPPLPPPGFEGLGETSLSLGLPSDRNVRKRRLCCC